MTDSDADNSGQLPDDENAGPPHHEPVKADIPPPFLSIDHVSSSTEVENNLDIVVQNPTAYYASTVLLHRKGDEVILEFSSGPIQKNGPHKVSLPIHSRIAMTASGAQGLYQLLKDQFGENSHD